MTSVAKLIVVAGVVAAAGCSSAPAPVPVAGAPADLGRLAGEWSGEYVGETTGRSGTIVFKLSAGADSAFGDVLMIPRERSPQRPPNDPLAGLPIPSTPEVLSIAFVRAAGGGVSGQLVPYRDPACDCTVVTRFEGNFRGDAIEGTFTSRRADQAGGNSRTGTWKIRRKKG